MRRLTRLGFVARGILYSLVGLLTLWSIVHNGAHAHGGMKTTFNSIHSLKPGVVLLGGLALGFLGFAAGMIWIALFDWNSHGGHPLGLVRRAGTFITGLVHLGLVVSSVLLIAGHETQGRSTRRWTELAMNYPFGRQAVAIAALYAVGFGIFLFFQAWTGRIDPLLDLASLDPVAARVANWTGRFGLFARGAIYVTIGVILAIAAVRGDASQVVGLGGAMRELSEHLYGVTSLAVIASGLFAYGCFMFIEARYRRIGESL
jgi:hypothetical protein